MVGHRGLIYVSFTSHKHAILAHKFAVILWVAYVHKHACADDGYIFTILYVLSMITGS